jgi:nucleoid DNA-binding protein
MLDSLYRYLFLKEQVSIPGVGSLRVRNAPATFEETSGRLDPPASTVVFEAGTALTDKEFYYFLSQQTGLSEVEGVRKFQDFAYQLRKDIQNNEYVELAGLGVFRRNATGNVVFESRATTAAYFSSLEPARGPGAPVREAGEDHGIEVYEEEQVIRKDGWWIWTLLIAAIAIGAIIYKYVLQAP